jgi:hypothetical protein
LKRFRAGVVLIFSLVLLLIMGFSIVQGADPTLVQNVATMKAPYSNGDDNSDGHEEGRSSQTDDADYDEATGLAYVLATSSSGPTHGSSSAWAVSQLADTFEIIHSSTYKISFSFNYKGLVEATSTFMPISEVWGASVNVILNILVIDLNQGKTVFEENEVIFSSTSLYDETRQREISGSRVLVCTLPLESNHAYEWKAGVRVETSAATHFFENGRASAMANFFDDKKGYQVEVSQVRVEDLNPDHVPPTTTYSLSGDLGENGWYTSSVSISLKATDSAPNSYGVDYTNIRINGGSWTRYSSPVSIGSEGVNTVEFYSVDKANNLESTNTVSVRLDKNAPTGKVVINNNQQYTTSNVVELSAQASDGQGSGVAQMRFRNQNGNWQAWTSYTTSPTSWTLTPRRRKQKSIRTVQRQRRKHLTRILR